MGKKVKHTLTLSVEIVCPHSIEYHDKLEKDMDSPEFQECEDVTEFLTNNLIGFQVELENEFYEEVEEDYNEIVEEES